MLDNRLRLDDIGAPLAVLDDSACVLDATPSATALIARFQLATALPVQLPADLARELASTPFGVPIISGSTMAVVLPVARAEDLE